MTRSLLLFDIDATLLLTDGAGMRAMKQAARELFGERFSWDGIETSGGLDPLLFAEAAARSCVPSHPENHRAFRDRYLSLLPQELERHPERVRAMPGILSVLGLLRSRADTVLGLLTGNYPAAAAHKLRAAGIDPSMFAVAAYGDEAVSRPQLGALALQRYRAAIADAGDGRGAAGGDPARTVIVGDTPRDVQCALENGFIAFAVATGRYSLEDLRSAGAHVAVTDLSDPLPLLRLLDGRLAGPSRELASGEEPEGAGTRSVTTFWTSLRGTPPAQEALQ